MGRKGSVLIATGEKLVIAVRHWYFVAGLSAMAVAPWLRNRFSLRTLLIATTVIAAVLGLATYASHK